MKPDSQHLIDQARHLAGRWPRRPRETDLRRAVSAAYYALFHTLCADSADLLIGTGGQQGWERAYRAVQHGDARKRCLGIRQRGSPVGGLRDFADAFVLLQDKRHEADYDPLATFQKSETLRLIDQAQEARTSLLAEDRAARRAFVAEIVFRSRP